MALEEGDAAQGVRHLVLVHGREGARQMVDAKRRLLVDIAAEVMADETQRIGISYTGFCLTALPHKRLADDMPWEKKGHKVALLVEPGRLRTAGRIKLYGVPYGALARMILLYLQTQAIRTGSREVALGRSMRDWMERMGLSNGGETAKALREQAVVYRPAASSSFGRTARQTASSAVPSCDPDCASTPRMRPRVPCGKTAWCSTRPSIGRCGIIRCHCWRQRSASSATVP
jgi:hypothetical protein